MRCARQLAWKTSEISRYDRGQTLLQVHIDFHKDYETEITYSCPHLLDNNSVCKWKYLIVHIFAILQVLDYTRTTSFLVLARSIRPIRLYQAEQLLSTMQLIMRAPLLGLALFLHTSVGSVVGRAQAANSAGCGKPHDAGYHGANDGNHEITSNGEIRKYGMWVPNGMCSRDRRVDRWPPGSYQDH